MKKRFFGAILAAALVVTQVVSVFAAQSRTTDMTAAGDSAAWYSVRGRARADFSELEGEREDVLDLIMKVNEGSATLEDIAREAPDIAGELQGKTLVTGIFRVEPINGGQPLADGTHRVTFSVPGLTTAMTNIKILHYSAERGVWEVITPYAVDYDAKTITADFRDLFAVAVIADIDESQTQGTGSAATNTSGSSQGVAPKTGVESDWMLYVGAAGIFAIAGIVLVKSRRRA